MIKCEYCRTRQEDESWCSQCGAPLPENKIVETLSDPSANVWIGSEAGYAIPTGSHNTYYLGWKE